MVFKAGLFDPTDGIMVHKKPWLRTTPLVFSARKSKSKVAVGVFYVFNLFGIANRQRMLQLASN